MIKLIMLCILISLTGKAAPKSCLKNIVTLMTNKEKNEFVASLFTDSGEVHKNYQGIDGLYKAARTLGHTTLSSTQNLIKKYIKRNKLPTSTYEKLAWGAEFYGSIYQHRRLPILLRNSRFHGIEGLKKFALKYANGRLDKAHNMASSLLRAKEMKTLNWGKVFKGDVNLYENLNKYLKKENPQTSEDLDKIASLFFNDNRSAAHASVSSLLGDEFKKRNFGPREAPKAKVYTKVEIPNLKEKYSHKQGLLELAKAHFREDITAAFQTFKAQLSRDEFEELLWDSGFKGNVSQYEMLEDDLKSGKFQGKENISTLAKKYFSGREDLLVDNAKFVLNHKEFVELGWVERVGISKSTIHDLVHKLSEKENIDHEKFNEVIKSLGIKREAAISLLKRIKREDLIVYEFNISMLPLEKIKALFIKHGLPKRVDFTQNFKLANELLNKHYQKLENRAFKALIQKLFPEDIHLFTGNYNYAAVKSYLEDIIKNHDKDLIIRDAKVFEKVLADLSKFVGFKINLDTFEKINQQVQMDLRFLNQNPKLELETFFKQDNSIEVKSPKSTPKEVATKVRLTQIEIKHVVDLIKQAGLPHKRKIFLNRLKAQRIARKILREAKVQRLDRKFFNTHFPNESHLFTERFFYQEQRELIVNAYQRAKEKKDGEIIDRLISEYEQLFGIKINFSQMIRILVKNDLDLDPIFDYLSQYKGNTSVIELIQKRFDGEFSNFYTTMREVLEVKIATEFHWYGEFSGNLNLFHMIKESIESGLYDGEDGLKRLSLDFFDGDIKKTYLSTHFMFPFNRRRRFGWNVSDTISPEILGQLFEKVQNIKYHHPNGLDLICDELSISRERAISHINKKKLNHIASSNGWYLHFNVNTHMQEKVLNHLNVLGLPSEDGTLLNMGRIKNALKKNLNLELTQAQLLYLLRINYADRPWLYARDIRYTTHADILNKLYSEIMDNASDQEMGGVYKKLQNRLREFLGMSISNAQMMNFILRLDWDRRLIGKFQSLFNDMEYRLDRYQQGKNLISYDNLLDTSYETEVSHHFDDAIYDLEQAAINYLPSKNKITVGIDTIVSQIYELILEKDFVDLETIKAELLTEYSLDDINLAIEKVKISLQAAR